MDMISREELRNLLEVRNDPCISLYMPVAARGQDTRQNPIRFKNLLNMAEKKNPDGRGRRVRELLEPARRLLDDTPFWQHQNEGLAVFSSPGLFLTYRLPVRFPELVLVQERFDVKPLLPYLSMDRVFHVLALSRKNPRFLECSRHNCRNLAPKGMPTGLEEIGEEYEFQRRTTVHGGPQGGGGDRGAAAYHGQGFGKEDEKIFLSGYLRRIQRVVEPVLARGNTPLILVGLDPLPSLYREVNSYPHLLDEAVCRSPREMGDDELHQAAWTVAEPLFSRARTEMENRYASLAGTGNTSRDLAEIFPAARWGRVESLLVAVGRVVWGRVSPDGAAVEIHETEQPGDTDLLGMAAVYALEKGAQVFPVPPDKMPGGADAAAVFRY
ncbi:MAG: hypothetical protein KKA60_15395 [Proteobacteria bacterium]|nr:hypothetical protein [Pseudomonadota bacterium]